LLLPPLFDDDVDERYEGVVLVFALLTAAEIAASIEFAPIALVEDAVGGFS
jgi:hypothetical protein